MMKAGIRYSISVVLSGVLSLSVGCHKSSPDSSVPSDYAQVAYGQVNDARLAQASKEPQNWMTYNGNWHEHRYSLLDSINVNNVSQLKPAWYAEFDTTRGQESTPLVVDGVMYVTTAWSKVYALDAKTGKQLWFYDPKVPGKAGVPMCCDVDNRGAAIYKGRVYVGTIDGRLVALDASNGSEVWSVQTTPRDSTYTITGAPRVARDKVFIGNSGADFGNRGYVSAYDAATGKLIWRFYTVPGDPNAAPDGAASDAVFKNLATATWYGEWYKYGGGGHVWNALIYDPEFNQVYMPTGNAFPWNPNIRSAGKGDNLFVASIVAVDADTGQYKWHYQESPGDGWDYDSIADIALTDLTIKGEQHKVLIHPPKNGFMYVLDRQTGKLLSADPYIEGINWATHVDLATGKPNISATALYKDKPTTISPGSGGGHNWQPIALDPKTNWLYLQTSDHSSSYLEPTRVKDYRLTDEKPSLGISFMGMLTGGMHGAAGINANGKDPSGKKTTPAPARAPAKSNLMAWDPVARKPAWKIEVPGGGGVLATAGGLVFQGKSRDGVLGEFAAYRSDTGERLWNIETPNAILAGPIAYSIEGEQYIAVASGANSMAIANPVHMPQRGRLLVFKLNGATTLPSDPPLAAPANPPAELASASDVKAGEAIYNEYCIRCHAPSVMGNNVIPDLRRSSALTQEQVWQSIVSDGAFEARGMMGWSRFIKRDQVEQIRLYVGEQARTLSQTTGGTKK